MNEETIQEQLRNPAAQQAPGQTRGTRAIPGNVDVVIAGSGPIGYVSLSWPMVPESMDRCSS